MGEQPVLKHACEVCKQNEMIAVVCVPGMPVSAAYCQTCLQANAHPWHYLVASIACLGGLENAAEWVHDMVNDTCTHLNKTLEEFKTAVAQSIADTDAYFNSLPEEDPDL